MGKNMKKTRFISKSQSVVPLIHSMTHWSNVPKHTTKIDKVYAEISTIFTEFFLIL